MKTTESPVTNEGLSPEELREHREQYYGSAKENHDNIGIMLTGLIQQHYGIQLPHPIPGHLVALVQVCVKANRAATPRSFNPDNYADGMAYFQIAGDVDERNPKNATEETETKNTDDRRVNRIRKDSVRTVARTRSLGSRSRSARSRR